jgi:hypothetical protein
MREFLLWSPNSLRATVLRTDVGNVLSLLRDFIALAASRLLRDIVGIHNSVRIEYFLRMIVVRGVRVDEGVMSQVENCIGRKQLTRCHLFLQQN